MLKSTWIVSREGGREVPRRAEDVAMGSRPVALKEQSFSTPTCRVFNERSEV